VSARLLLAAASLLAIALPSSAQDIAITHATVALGDGSAPIEGATVVVRGGRVVSAGAGVAVPAGMRAVDGTGMWVTPGLFASITNLGLSDVDAVDESSDVSADGSPFSAALDVSPVINSAAQDIAISRAGGITRASVTPEAGSEIFAGQGALINLGLGRTPVTDPRAFQLVELGERGAQLSGGSRTSAHAMLRNALIEASSFAAAAQLTGIPASRDLQTPGDLTTDPRVAGRGVRETDVMLTRFDAAALVPVVSGQQKLYVRVQRASDILAALELTEIFPDLDLVLVGATEGWMVADAIAAAGVPVIAAALNDLPESFERLAATQSNIGRMVDAGVTVGIGGYESSGDHPRSLPQMAGNLVAVARMPGAAGLTEGTGTLAAGAPGDVVLWDGDPLELSSAPVRVFIEGVEQPLDNHQTRLRDRYRSLDESTLPRGMVR